MTSIRKIGITATAFTLLSTLFVFNLQVDAATSSSNGMVHAQVNGKVIQAIAVGDTTYLEWNALQAFHTPYAYMGNGKFAITGGSVQGVVYKGNTYLPWNTVAPSVKASRLKSGGFNFTAISVQHDYHVEIFAQDGTNGYPNPIEIFVVDGDKFIPNQKVEISLTGNSNVSDFGDEKLVTITTDNNGSWLGSINDDSVETVNPTVTWVDPNGMTHSKAIPVTFSSSAQSQSNAPSNENVVATVPMTTFQNALLLNAKGSGGQNILFQLDTGAYEPLVSKQVAKLLDLPNLGNTLVEGVGGEDNAYFSEMNLTIGGHEFTNIPCMVDDNYSGPSLFGYEFFADNGYDLVVSQKNSTITISK